MRSMIGRALRFGTSRPLGRQFVQHRPVHEDATGAGGLVPFKSVNARYTHELKFLTPSAESEGIPVYRVMDSDGKVAVPENDPNLPEEELVKMYRSMAGLSIMDNILYESQRQGRLSSYITNLGEEGAQVGSASALSPEDFVFSQYREAGVLVYRGFTFEEFCNQCLTNRDDASKGRNMPMGYGSRKLNFMVVSAPLATQLPHAVGTAYAFKRAQNGRVVIAYFGDGAASEGDAHASFNFAATLDCPVILFCRNNGYAISTPVHEQYRGDGIAARGPAYGITTVRVDGNDVLAVRNATSAARSICLRESRPVLIEAMTYRLGHHSTSDDSTSYRSADEVEYWRDRENPIGRFRRYLTARGLWDEAKEEEFGRATRREVLAALTSAEKKPKPRWQEMFVGVYRDPTPQLEAQMKAMENHLEGHEAQYQDLLKDFEK